MQVTDLDIRKQMLGQRLTETRNDLLALLRTLPAAKRTQPGVSGHWSAKDLVGHIASWENRYVTLVQHLINGESDQIRWLGSEEAVQAWNQRQAQRKNDWSWPEVIRELALMREELLWNLELAPAEQLFELHATPAGAATVSAADLLAGLAAHDQEHAEQLRAWLGEASDPGV